VPLGVLKWIARVLGCRDLADWGSWRLYLATVLGSELWRRPLASSKRELVLAMPGGLGLADVLGEQVAQDDAAEISRRGLERP
jgi:hypothetical protein